MALQLDLFRRFLVVVNQRHYYFFSRLAADYFGRRNFQANAIGLQFAADYPMDNVFGNDRHRHRRLLNDFYFASATKRLWKTQIFNDGISMAAAFNNNDYFRLHSRLGISNTADLG